MAARLNPSHDARTRDKIKTSQLINRLGQHALGQVEMTPTQVKAAQVLLSKTLPDLSAVDMTHAGEIQHNFVVRVPAKASDKDAWKKSASGSRSQGRKPTS